MIPKPVTKNLDRIHQRIRETHKVRQQQHEMLQQTLEQEIETKLSRTFRLQFRPPCTTSGNEKFHQRGGGGERGKTATKRRRESPVSNVALRAQGCGSNAKAISVSTARRVHGKDFGCLGPNGTISFSSLIPFFSPICVFGALSSLETLLDTPVNVAPP